MPESIFASEYAAIVFDCDGTLMDTEECWKTAREVVLDSYGVTPSESFAARTTGMHYSECGRLMAELAGRPGLSEIMTRQLLDAFRRLAAENPTTMPGAAELVPLVHQLGPLAVASNCPGDVVETCLDAAGLLGYFRYIAVPGERDRPKPYPDVYRTASERCGADPAHCLAFEDTACGIKSAVSAGMRVIGIGAGCDADEAELADHWVASLADPELVAWASGKSTDRTPQRPTGPPRPRTARTPIPRVR